ncbi:MAG: hypothetical protein DHS20C16_11980 [Phycisphaerae bacterium]|nr:MAG: hypothetical protein DHS20C16_11980 [Phycisphaerae bacterium]
MNQKNPCIHILVAAATLALIASEVRAQTRGGDPVIYDNGSFITANDGCPDFGYTGRSTPSAPNTALGLGIDGRSARVADDFEIPVGQSWDMTRLIWRMYQVNTPITTQIARAHVRIWTSNPLSGGTPILGDLLIDRHEFTIDAGAHRTGTGDTVSCARRIMNVEIDMNWAPVLPAGHYWVEVALHTDELQTIFGPPTEPRGGADNGIRMDLAGDPLSSTDIGSGLPMDFPFQFTGQLVADPVNACALPNGTCQNATRDNCENTLNGTWSFSHPCAELGACCDFASGDCADPVEPEACVDETQTFFEGVTCAALPICGAVNGACCFPDDTPVDCQSFTSGVNCTAAGGYWHPGSCGLVECFDYCETPAPVTDGISPFVTSGATTDGPQANQDCALDPLVGTADIWLRYQSTLLNSNGAVTFSICNNDGFDATLQVYQTDASTICDDLKNTSLAEYCDNDGCGVVGGSSLVNVSASPGDEFLIRIGGYDGDSGGGQLEILPIEAGTGACCTLDGQCNIVSEGACSSVGGAFLEGADCFNAQATCGPIGACCLGTDGCVETPELGCTSQSGMFLGDGSTCVSPADCDGDGETNFCALAGGAPDCNENTIPDSCDIDPIIGITTDCDGNTIPDECELLPLCCPGDPDLSKTIDAGDITHIVDALLASTTDCQTLEYCRTDTNQDQRLNGKDIAAFVNLMQSDPVCDPVLHVSARVIVPPPTDRANAVFVLDQDGELLRSYPQVPAAAADGFGYRDGASDGTYVYFGWIGGVARHNADGSGGVQIITGPTPGTETTWRTLAYDPTGDGGNGSLWTQSFFSDLVESDLSGNLLNQFPNSGEGFYGMTYNNATGMLWGHGLDGTTLSARIYEIDPETGLLTGVSHPSHHNVPGGADDGFAFYGGLSSNDATGTMFGVLQGSPNDGIFSMDSSGALTPPLSPNPRVDFEFQSGTNAALGVAAVQP